MDPLAEYTSLKNELHALERAAARAEGALKEVKDRLRQEFGVGTVKAARHLLRKLESEENELAAQLDKDLVAFKKQYPDLGRDG